MDCIFYILIKNFVELELEVANLEFLHPIELMSKDGSWSKFVFWQYSSLSPAIRIYKI